MNTFLLSALALAAAGGAPTEGGEEWLSLDREIASLSTSLAQDKSAPKVSAWIKTSYQHSSDVMVAPEDNDLGGFFIDNLRLTVSGKVGDYQLKLQGEGSSGGNPGNFSVRDAFVRFPLAENVHAQMGNFKSPFLFSSYASITKLVFYERSTIGATFSGREPGLLLEGTFDHFLVWLSAQNGDDLQGDELLFTAKASFTTGTPIVKQSGGYGPDAPTSFTGGLAWISDETEDDTSAIAAEAMLASGPWWFHAEIVDIDDGFLDAMGDPTVQNGVLSRVDDMSFNDSMPWDLTAAYAIDEHWELALRFESFDDDDTTAYWAGVNRYVQGHAAKWQLDFITTDSDDSDLEIDLLLLGLVVEI